MQRISQNKSDLETMTSRLRDLLSEIDSLPPASTPGMLRAQAKLIQYVCYSAIGHYLTLYSGNWCGHLPSWKT